MVNSPGWSEALDRLTVTQLGVTVGTRGVPALLCDGRRTECPCCLVRSRGGGNGGVVNGERNAGMAAGVGEGKALVVPELLELGDVLQVIDVAEGLVVADVEGAAEKLDELGGVV